MHTRAINGGIYMAELVLGFIAATGVLNLIGNIIILAGIRGIFENK